MVRGLYAWVADERLSVRQGVRRLNEGPWVTRAGRTRWAPSTVHHILSDPVYIGTAYANRYEYVAPKRPRARSPRCDEKTCRRPRPRDQWIAIPVPPLVDQETWDRAQAQMARNALVSGGGGGPPPRATGAGACARTAETTVIRNAARPSEARSRRRMDDLRVGGGSACNYRTINESSSSDGISDSCTRRLPALVA